VADDNDGGEVLIEGLPDNSEGPTLHGERCPECGQAKRDDFSTMEEMALMDHLRVELLRNLARGFRDGTITHQEKAIIRGLLRDNSSKVPKSASRPEPDPDVPQAEHPSRLPEGVDFPVDDYDATEGG
jgi:hypothetical protein